MGLRRAGIPGTGQETSERCGEWTGAAGVCSGHGTAHPVHLFRYSCHHLDCPTCYRGTLVRNAEAAAQRIDGYRHALKDLHGTLAGALLAYEGDLPRPRAPRHFTLSPPPEVAAWMAEEVQKSLAWKGLAPSEFAQAFTHRFRQEVYYHLRGLTLDASAVIIHLWRVTAEGKALHRKAKPGIPVWDWLRTHPDREALVYFSPHAHLIAYGYALDAGMFHLLSFGWVYKLIRTVDNLEALLFYLLGHVQVVNGRVSITYWGGLSPRRLRTTKREVLREDLVCSECGALMVHATLDVHDPGRILDLTDRAVVLRRVRRTYHFEGPPT